MVRQSLIVLSTVDGSAAHARKGLDGALTGGKGITDTTAAADHEPWGRRQDAATFLISLEDAAMHVKVGWRLESL